MREQICERIGTCKIDSSGNITELERDFLGQGWVFKDWKAFRENPDAPCYVAELDDTVYTKNGFIELCKGQEEIAEKLFDEVDWQSPSTLLDEWEREGEIAVCGYCGNMFLSHGISKCPDCGTLKAEG